MNSEDEMLVKEKLLRLLSETEKYDFPFLAGVDKKKLIIITRKHDLDEKMLGIMSIFRLKIPSLFLSDDVWKQTKKEVRDKFENLSEEQLLNGFYFQELMHEYVSNNIRLIDESWLSEE